MRTRIALAALALFLLPAVTRADEVTLTPGSSVIADSGLTRFNLLGPGFSLIGSTDLQSPTPSGFRFTIVNTISGTGNVAFNGVESRFFRGGAVFTDTFISGGVTAYANFEDLGFSRNPLFTVNFSGAGFLTTAGSPIVRTFTVATPEPTTLLLLGTGLAGVAAKARKRRKGSRRV